jgi:hypothetical protein
MWLHVLQQCLVSWDVTPRSLGDVQNFCDLADLTGTIHPTSQNTLIFRVVIAVWMSTLTDRNTSKFSIFKLLFYFTVNTTIFVRLLCYIQHYMFWPQWVTFRCYNFYMQLSDCNVLHIHIFLKICNVWFANSPYFYTLTWILSSLMWQCVVWKLFSLLGYDKSGRQHNAYPTRLYLHHNHECESIKSDWNNNRFSIATWLLFLSYIIHIFVTKYHKNYLLGEDADLSISSK